MLLGFLGSCQKSHTPSELQGLWELKVLEVDGVVRNHAPYFLQLHEDGSFALAKRSGDLRGFYHLKGDQIKFSSSDSKWFNRQWTLEMLQGTIRLKGRGDYGKRPFYVGGPIGVLNSRLTFTPVDQVPDFQAFEDAVVGKWELYRIRKNGDSEKLENTWMTLESGQYALSGPDHFESGEAVINTRYRKVFFEGQETAWDAWFFGEELRLSNQSLSIEYSLRK